MSGCLSGSPCDDILTLIGEQVMVQRARLNFSQVLKHIEEGDESDGDLLDMVWLDTPMIPARMQGGGPYQAMGNGFTFWDYCGYENDDEGREWDEELGSGDYKEESVFWRWGNKWCGNMWKV